MQNKGITLIALVITIIILILLSGVTIATLTGDNGIITKAIEAKQKTEQAQIDEQLNLAILSAKLKKQGEAITLQDVLEELQKQGVEFEKQEDGTLIIGGNYSYKIEEKDGEITWERKTGTVTPNVAFISLSEENGKVLTGSSKVVTITGENYGTLNCFSSDENIATASLSGNILTVTGTSTSDGTESATITITGSKGGKAIYNIESHKHYGNATSGGGCYGKSTTTSKVCGGSLVDNTSSTSVCGGELIVTSTNFSISSVGCPDGCTMLAGPYYTRCQKCGTTGTLSGAFHYTGSHGPSNTAPSVGSSCGSCNVSIKEWICPVCHTKSTSGGTCTASTNIVSWSMNCGF